ncbi:plectin [Actinocorallia sp. A-T 12471]|uniref:plectin n=1 Tax=Actinocorallia sp. A-T 12471 TaxID=3089813 RepID=UPI0029CF1EC9|nr:plectin [Actinocorallia sp. A-T 12471]MDX6739964.1 plectin [Actinocorallia sp. A-T 12471]
MVFRRRYSADDAAHYADDKQLAKEHASRLAKVEEARAALAAGAPDTAGRRELAGALEAAYVDAIASAAAAERVAMGLKTYGTTRPAEIARRKARAKASVRPYSEELDRLRTAREAHKLSYRALERV